LTVIPKATLDPWAPTNSTVYTAAQLLQYGKFEWFGNVTGNEIWGITVVELDVTFAEKI
jgi:hypothetical protein